MNYYWCFNIIISSYVLFVLGSKMLLYYDLISRLHTCTACILAGCSCLASRTPTKQEHLTRSPEIHAVQIDLHHTCELLAALKTSTSGSSELFLLVAPIEIIE